MLRAHGNLLTLVFLFNRIINNPRYFNVLELFCMSIANLT